MARCRGLQLYLPPVSTQFEAKIDSSFNNETGFYEYNLTLTCKVLSNGISNVRIFPSIIYTDSSKYEMINFTDNMPVVKTGPSGSFTKKFNSIIGFQGLYPARIEVLVLNCDEHYARYVNASSGFNLNDGLPGAEPRIPYSNMSNKIGIIGSYNVSSVSSINF